MAFEIESFDKLKESLEEQGGQYNYALIERAFHLCFQAHKEQKRASGEPYFLHPFSVTKILISMGMDSESICAGLLHDVVEDTDITLTQIQSQFNRNIALLVDGVTKLGKISIPREQQQSENIRKMLIAMSEDIRVIIIKLADRLHNMRTLDFLPEQKQRDISLETIEVYAPIAHRLGIRAVKEELEDLAIKHLDPIAYGEVVELLNARKIHRDDFLQRIQNKIRARVSEYVPDIYVEGRIKSIHGIYRKMY
ncbi:MAG: HD domain-containing protein, partial [Clostridia bacterium]|nr:HD domain-containing protein [Clostridia bacterium]